jgi:hypothetical protein
MEDLQARIWKPRERVLVRYVFKWLAFLLWSTNIRQLAKDNKSYGSAATKWYDYVTMLVFCFNMGNIISVNNIPSDSER